MALDDCCSLEARAPGSSCTPLMVAAAAGRADMCRALLDVGARPEAKDSASGATAFLMAAFKGHSQVVELLLDRAETTAHGRRTLLQETTRKGESALMAASKAGHLEAAKVLLRRGACPSDRAAMGPQWTALHLAARKGHSAVVGELLSHGADIEGPDAYGMTPLMHAALGGAHGCVRALLGSQPAASTEPRDQRGRTALHHAAAAGSVDAAVASAAAKPTIPCPPSFPPSAASAAQPSQTGSPPRSLA